MSPVGFTFAGLLLSMPFVAVSCEVPGGFGRATQSGTTTYRGVDLLTGGAPDVTADHLRPAVEQLDDRLDPQPLSIVAAVLLLVGAAVVALRDVRVRRATTALVAAVAVVFLVASQTTVSVLLRMRLKEQLTVPLPAGRRAADYVHHQSGFWLCLAVLGSVAVVNALGWLQARPPVSPGSPGSAGPRVAGPGVATAAPLPRSG
jgi:hypothetical protein